MLDQFKAMGALAGLMKNQDRLRQAGEDLKDRLEEIHAQGEAGGGAVRVTASCHMKIISVQLSPAATAAADEESRSLLQSLIIEASNEALFRARALAQAEVTRMAQEMGLPDLPGLDRLLPGG